MRVLEKWVPIMSSFSVILDITKLSSVSLLVLCIAIPASWMREVFFWGQFEKWDGVLFFWSENLIYMREHASKVFFRDIFYFVCPVLIYRVCEFLFQLRSYFV